MIGNGEFTVAALQRLNAIMLNVQEKGRAFETVTDFTAGWSKVELWNTRAAMFAIFENGPLLRAIDRVIANHGRSDRKPSPRRARRFSVFPDELPGPWQAAFRDMDAGYPGENGTVSSPAMILTMKAKACEFIRHARDTGLAEDLSIPAAIAYERSLGTREKPLSARTILSAIRQIRDLGRYIGVENELLVYLASRIRIHEKRSQGAIPQKEAKIQTLPDYSQIFGMALDMLGRAAMTRNARSAQRLRNMAVAITLFSPFPLRAADTQLRFGDQILWDGGEYRFDLIVSKTQRRFVALVIPVFGWFIDQLVLQGSGPEHLADIRAECFQQHRLLLVNYDDSAAHQLMVSYYWGEALATGYHAARTHLHDASGDWAVAAWSWPCGPAARGPSGPQRLTGPELSRCPPVNARAAIWPVPSWMRNGKSSLATTPDASAPEYAIPTTCPGHISATPISAMSSVSSRILIGRPAARIFSALRCLPLYVR
ncbi:hypothetical protein [uncultured Paracoccus sp.]|uniref:hypothetical protein n=1 Tax=uncultured Paracoccus sp. TaxID=189685 RepID=UPI0025EBCD7B|nr:hypothetical protein [uncultured Paracoccus sp.]